DVARRAREEIRKHALGLNDAAVSEAGLARRVRQAVDQRDRPPARLKSERGRDADNSRAEHNGVNGLGHGAAALLHPWRGALVGETPPRISASVPIDPGRQEQTESAP